VSKIDSTGAIVSTCTEAMAPVYLAADSDDYVFVACSNDCVLLLNSHLHDERCLVDETTSREMRLWRPTQLCYNEATSEIYVLHSSRYMSSVCDNISRFRVRWVTGSSLLYDVSLCRFELDA